MSVVALVPAAGSGQRLGADVPKAFVTVGGRALLLHAVDRLLAAGVDRVVVAVPNEQIGWPPCPLRWPRPAMTPR